MTSREALIMLARGAIVQSFEGPPIYHHPEKGFMYQLRDKSWQQFGANLAAGIYEVILGIARPK
jgi:hypothetical protein